MDINPRATAAQRLLPGEQQKLRDAHAIGLDAVNRLHVLINAAYHIAASSDERVYTVTFLRDLLREARNLAEDMSGTLEAERDQYVEQEGK